ncbi:MAG: AMP-binding protein [Lachnospiraceae bacterium]|nr:AMP-binding protein [Lachnospiraceae bacterium]
MDYPYLDTVIYNNFYEMLKGRYEDSGDRPAIRYFKGKEIVGITYREMTERIADVYSYLRELGEKGLHIGILSENRYEYIILYLAAVMHDVIVPLDKEMDPGMIAGCVDRFDIDVLFYTNKTKGKVEFPDSSCQLRNLDEVFGDICAGSQGDTQDFFRKVADTDKDRFAVLASTSGTDGEMKGVMLSQYNVITNIRGTLENNVLKNPTLAFLPMNHTYGFNPCILATLYNGTTVCLNLNMKHLMRDIKAFDPYFFGAVPMVIEGMYENIIREVKRQNKEKNFKRMIRISQFFLRWRIDLRHLFFGKIINPNLRLVVNGGAPLNRDYVRKFGELGITILNGYGLTECSPTIAVSRVGNNVPGSSGTIMKHIDVKIAEDGEILVKGPNVMLGYYKNEEATAACMRDGYYATGDIGYTEGKVICVTGRKKNLIILENGKNVPPEYLEDKLNGLPYVKESLIVPKRAGGRNRILLAKIVLVEDVTDDIKDERNQTEDEDTEQTGAQGQDKVFAQLEERLKQDIREINESLPSYMRIEDYEIMREEFEKNSSKKIKRNLYMDP